MLLKFYVEMIKTFSLKIISECEIFLDFDFKKAWSPWGAYHKDLQTEVIEDLYSSLLFYLLIIYLRSPQ